MRIARQRTDTAHADRAEIAARNLQRLKRLRDQISGRCLAVSAGDADAEQVLRSIVVVAGCNLASRSEEHTSELQSLMRISYAVFCLKKQKQQQKEAPDKNIIQHEDRKTKSTTEYNTYAPNINI